VVVGLLVAFSVFVLLLIYGIIEYLLDNIVYKIKIYFLNRQQKKENEKYFKKLHEEPANFVMILSGNIKNGNLKNDMSKINIIDPKGNKLVVVFGSYWNDMKDFYIDVYGNDNGFKYIIRQGFTDTQDILKEYIKYQKKLQKESDKILAESYKNLLQYYWQDFEFQNMLLYEPNEHTKTILKLRDLKSTTQPIVDERYECERCLKKITYKEYELYDCMCEDCFEDISYKGDDCF